MRSTGKRCASVGRRRATKRVSVVGVLALLFVGGGIGFAAWTINGTGNATTTAATANVLTVGTGTAPVQGLYPTATNLNIPVSVTNTNPFKVEVNALTVGTITDNNASCTATTVTASDVSGLTTVLEPAGSAGDSASFNVPVSMSNAAENACQGAVFTLPVTATGVSTN